MGIKVVGKTYFDEGRARIVFEVLDRLWKEQKGIFRNEFLPQNQVNHPENFQERANWLFCAVLTQRGGLLSEQPFGLLSVLLKKNPEMFNPKEVSLWPLDAIREAFIDAAQIYYGNNEKGAGSFNYKLGEHPFAWKNNAEVISRCWDGDPRSIFKGVSDFEGAFARVDHKRNNGSGLKGMRRKIFALYTIWMQEQDLIPVFPSPFPVDFHALRILFSSSIIPASQFRDGIVRVSERLVNDIHLWSQGFIVAEGFSHLRINPALWMLSRNLCARSAQHGTRNSVERQYSPTSPTSAEWNMLWSKDRIPCVYCPVEKWCQWVIPSAPYYHDGKIEILGERHKCADTFLPGILSHDVVSKRYLKGRSKMAPRIEESGGVYGRNNNEGKNSN